MQHVRHGGTDRPQHVDLRRIAFRARHLLGHGQLLIDVTDPAKCSRRFRVHVEGAAVSVGLRAMLAL